MYAPVPSKLSDYGSCRKSLMHFRELFYRIVNYSCEHFLILNYNLLTINDLWLFGGESCLENWSKSRDWGRDFLPYRAIFHPRWEFIGKFAPFVGFFEGQGTACPCVGQQDEQLPPLGSALGDDAPVEFSGPTHLQPSFTRLSDLPPAAALFTCSRHCNSLLFIHDYSKKV